MLTTIKGYYQDGHIILTEAPPVTDKTEVIITFLTKEELSTKGKKKIPLTSRKKSLVPNSINERTKEKRKLGGLKGKVTIPDDFNEPLEDLKEYM
jgi:hypothetical protein